MGDWTECIGCIDCLHETDSEYRRSEWLCMADDEPESIDGRCTGYRSAPEPDRFD